MLLEISSSILFYGGKMSDLIYLGLTVLFFLLTLGFIVVCERLMEEKP
jgi:hypothetical protein